MPFTPRDENDKTRRKIAELNMLSARLTELEEEMRLGLLRIAELMDPAEDPEAMRTEETAS